MRKLILFTAFIVLIFVEFLRSLPEEWRGFREQFR